jgi:hypothetical protein
MLGLGWGGAPKISRQAVSGLIQPQEGCLLIYDPRMVRGEGRRAGPLQISNCVRTPGLPQVQDVLLFSLSGLENLSTASGGVQGRIIWIKMPLPAVSHDPKESSGRHMRQVWGCARVLGVVRRMTNIV